MEVLGHIAHSNKLQHLQEQPLLTYGDRIDRNSACFVKIYCAVRCFVPQESPPSAVTAGPFNPSSGASRWERRATGQCTTQDYPNINIMHWNAEGISSKKAEPEQYLYQTSIGMSCIQESHLQEGKISWSEGIRLSIVIPELGYDTLDKQGDDIEAWQDEKHLILVNRHTSLLLTPLAQHQTCDSAQLTSIGKSVERWKSIYWVFFQSQTISRLILAYCLNIVYSMSYTGQLGNNIFVWILGAGRHCE